MYHIVFKVYERPSLDDSPLLTDEWWDICRSCWNRDAPGRPVMSDIVKALQV